MITTKVIQTSVDLFDADDIFAVDIKALLLKKLTARYVGKCFSYLLITEILEIIRYSDRYMVDNRLDGAAYINVQFKVAGVSLDKDEVLHGCKVVKITNTSVIVDHKYATGMVLADPKKKVISIIKKDQIIPVIISDVRYNVGKPQITMRCYPYIPQQPTQYYYNINDPLSPEETEKVSLILEAIEAEQKQHDSKSKAHEFFKNFMYPYKTQQKFTQSPVGSKFTPVKLELKDILQINSGCVTDDIDGIYHSKNSTSSEQLKVIIGPLYPAISSILNRRLQYLSALRGFAEQYDTPEKIQEMMTYWKVCMSLKE